MLTETKDIVLQQGLIDQEYRIELLLDLWTELQKSSADAARAPALDFFSFVHNAFYFAVVYHKKEKDTSIRPQSSTSQAVQPLTIGGEGRSFSWFPSEPLMGNDEYPEDQTHRAVSCYPNLIPIGCVFLTCSMDAGAPSGELSASIIIDQRYRKKGFAGQTMQLIMRWVFEDLHFHRLQAVVLDGPHKIQAVTLFTQLGFGHEGIRRRSIYSQVEEVWKDATHLAILDTDWLMRSFWKPAPRSLWDEMFVRHDRERQSLLRWDFSGNHTPIAGASATARILKRTGSLETVRAVSEAPEASASTSASRSACDARSDVSVSGNPGARDGEDIEARQAIWERPSSCTRSLSPESSDVSVVGDSDIEDQNILVDEWRANVGSPPLSPTPSNDSREHSGSPEGSIGSQWDLVEDPFDPFGNDS